ncbi:fungal specific transcription factor domain-containing protein [Apiospora rasikravindrae]|uniref:Fungal specific transcription factor domain-containing protein n=1 Tax=Apiospora rasikravindrae TaxID=990691 RepID=A0ABR1T9X0_9PEZI
MPDGDSEPARHTCQCGRSFIRKEHLIRHQAVHGSASHVCPQCQRSFTRSDLLRRHLQRHVETAANGRRGVARACDACHGNKLTWDRLGVSAEHLVPCVSKRGIACSLLKKGLKHGAASSTQSPQETAGSSQSPETEERAATNSAPPLNSVQIIGMMSVRGEEDQNLPSEYVERMQEVLRAEGPEEAMSRLLSDNRSRSLSILGQTGGQFENFAEEHLKTYINVFHEAWPLLQATTLDVLKDNLHLASSIITIGILLKKDASDISRSKALFCHEIMIGLSFQRLTEAPRGSTIEAWPMEWYQAVLLNIIIGIMCNELSQSRLLCSLFIAHLRFVGMFDSTVAEAQTKIYHSGTFLPFVLSIIEQRSRLIAYLFKADAILSLLDDQPPMLYAEELDTRLPQTFALWNAYGIDVFFKRYEEEPGHRASHKLNDIVGGPFVFTTASIVAEDVEFGLWALVREVWQHRQRLQMERGRKRASPDTTTANSNNDSAQSNLLHRLRGWKYQLAGLQRLCSTSDADTNTGEGEANALRLIRAYRGDDDAKPHEEWQQLARKRAHDRVRAAMDLHDVLESRLHSCSSRDSNHNITAGSRRDIGIRHTLLQSLDMSRP